MQTPYNPFEKNNSAFVNSYKLVIKKDEPVYYLEYFDVGTSLTSRYIMVNWKDSPNILPTNFESGWSLKVDFATHDQVLNIKIGDKYLKVIDSAENTYLILEKE